MTVIYVICHTRGRKSAQLFSGRAVGLTASSASASFCRRSASTNKAQITGTAAYRSDACTSAKITVMEEAEGDVCEDAAGAIVLSGVSGQRPDLEAGAADRALSGCARLRRPALDVASCTVDGYLALLADKGVLHRHWTVKRLVRGAKEHLHFPLSAQSSRSRGKGFLIDACGWSLRAWWCRKESAVGRGSTACIDVFVVPSSATSDSDCMEAYVDTAGGCDRSTSPERCRSAARQTKTKPKGMFHACRRLSSTPRPRKDPAAFCHPSEAEESWACRPRRRRCSGTSDERGQKSFPEQSRSPFPCPSRSSPNGGRISEDRRADPTASSRRVGSGS